MFTIFFSDEYLTLPPKEKANRNYHGKILAQTNAKYSLTHYGNKSVSSYHTFPNRQLESILKSSSLAYILLQC